MTVTSRVDSIRHVFGAVVTIAFVFVGGCATASQSTEPEATTPEVRSTVETGDDDEAAPQPSVDQPSEEALASSPCGNPDWAQLPPDSEIDGDPETKDDSNDEPE